MNRSQMCVANVKYKQPSADGERQTRNLLKYLTYRPAKRSRPHVLACDQPES
jgi:hypothetical protein